MAAVPGTQGSRSGVRTAIFRADGSDTLGMGHIMRCLAFAAELDRRGVKSVFVAKDYNPGVAEVIRAGNFRVEEIPSGLSGDEDARLTRKIASGLGDRLVVTDLCTRPAMANRPDLDIYHRALAPGFFMVSLAGGQIVDLPGDIVVSPYVITAGAAERVNGQTCLLGPSYFIFRPEFIAAANGTRTIPGEARRVLVLVGGSDELHLTAMIVEALCRIPAHDLALRVVVGALYPEVLKVRIPELLTKFDGEYELLGQDSDLADAMLWSDLAIIGDGLVKYEAAVTGTPSIMISRVDSEAAPNQVFEQAGTTLHLGDGAKIPVHVLAEKINSVLEDVELRRSMSKRGSSLVDGKGLDRIIAHIPSEVLG